MQSRQKFANKKDEIVFRSIPLFIRSGMNGISLAELSRGVHVSKPMIQYYFKTPEDVFIHIIKLWSENGKDVTNKFLESKLGAKPQEIIVGILEAMYYWADEEPQFAQLSLSIFAAQSNKMVLDEISKAFLGGRTRIFKLLKMLVARDEKRLWTTALNLHSVIVGALVADLMADKETRLQLRKMYLENINILLTAVRRDSSNV